MNANNPLQLLNIKSLYFQNQPKLILEKKPTKSRQGYLLERLKAQTLKKLLNRKKQTQQMFFEPNYDLNPLTIDTQNQIKRNQKMLQAIRQSQVNKSKYSYHSLENESTEIRSSSQYLGNLSQPNIVKKQSIQTLEIDDYYCLQYKQLNKPNQPIRQLRRRRQSISSLILNNSNNKN